jgi:hypothetical protein
MKYTRKQYMAHECTHAQYYEGITDGLTLRMIPRGITRDSIATDPHLNNVALKLWDTIAVGYYDTLAPRFKDAGDILSLAGAVCAVKHMAKRQTLA